MLPMHLQSLNLLRPTVEKMHLQEKTLFIFYLNTGPKSHELLPNTLSIMLPMHLQSLKLLRQTVEKMQLQEKYIIYLLP